jgi:hypothetical protein
MNDAATAAERNDDIVMLANMIITQTEPTRENGAPCWASELDWFRWACDIAGIEFTDAISAACDANEEIDDGSRDALDIAAFIYDCIEEVL